MTGIVPNTGATYARQAVLDTIDLEAIQMGSNLTGVVSGCATTTAGGVMTVAVAAGVVRIAGKPVTVSGATSDAMTADGSNPRWYLVTINASGSVVVTAGTAAADPKLPSIPATSVVVAAVYLPAATSAITSAMIVDKRVTVERHNYYDVQWYGAVGDGTTDDTVAIQAAVDAAAAAGGSRESKVLFTGLKSYLITDTITLPSGGWVEGESFAGAQGPYVKVKATTDITKHAFAMTTTDRSRVCFRNLRIEDLRTDVSRTGNGIHINDVTNGSYIENCFVANFYDNIYVGGGSVGQEADTVLIRDVWTVDPVRYGIHIQRLNNRAHLENVYIDSGVTTDNGTDAGVYIVGTSGSSGVTMDTIKHENLLDGCHGVIIDGGGEHSISNYTMRGTTDNPASDIVRCVNATGALTLTLRGINCKNTTASYGDSVITAGNLLNVASGSVGTFTIPVTTLNRAIGLFVSSWPTSAIGGIWLGPVRILSGTGDPEGVVTAPVGSLFLRSDGGSATCLYAKESGTGTAGWVAR